MENIKQTFAFLTLFMLFFNCESQKLFGGPIFKIKVNDDVKDMVAQPQTIIARKPIHWIFAIDQSKSMEGTRWDKMKTLTEKLASKIKQYNEDKMSVFTFNNRATLPPEKYMEFDDPANWNPAGLQFRGGSTQAGNAVMRIIQLMLLHRSTNTCIVLIADNFVGVPAIQLNLYGQTIQYLKTIKTTVCVECYHIKQEQNQQVPSSFDYTCGLLKKPFSSSTPKTYVTTPEQFYGSGSINLETFSGSDFQETLTQAFEEKAKNPTFV